MACFSARVGGLAGNVGVHHADASQAGKAKGAHTSAVEVVELLTAREVRQRKVQVRIAEQHAEVAAASTTATAPNVESYLEELHKFRHRGPEFYLLKPSLRTRCILASIAEMDPRRASSVSRRCASWASSSPRRDSMRFSWPSLCCTSLAVSTSRALMRSRSAVIFSTELVPPAGRRKESVSDVHHRSIFRAG